MARNRGLCCSHSLNRNMHIILVPLFLCILVGICHRHHTFAATAVDSVNCQWGWTGFGHNGKRACYKVFHQITEYTRTKYYYHYHPHRYYDYRSNEVVKQFTFEDAQEKCQKEYNGTLVAIQSRLEYSFIRALIIRSHDEVFNATAAYDEHRFWIGMRLERDGNGTLVNASWTSNAPVTFGNPLADGHQRGQYPWGIDSGYGGEPNNVGGKEDCIAIGASVRKDGFVDVRCCDKLYGLICEKKALVKKCNSWRYTGDTTGSKR